MTPQARTRSTSAPRPNPYSDQSRLFVLQTMMCSRLDELMVTLGVGLRRSSKMYFGCCPVHGGSKENALNLYTDGESLPGYWRCYSHNCHRVFKPTIIGFVRGVLSHQRLNWSSYKDGDAKKVTWKDAVDWCCKFIGQKIGEIKVDYAELEKRRFASGVSLLTRKPEQGSQGVTREQIRARLEIPADYFVGRGWSREVLDRYDVGLCTNPKQPMFGRVVVPIYDPEYRFMVGCTARSTLSACEVCGLYHQGDCPQGDEKRHCSKWRNSLNFNREQHLYNYWFARNHIRKAGIVVLCEGPGDVLRLEEAGIHVGVGMFGNNLGDLQQVILEMSGATNVIVLTNNDEAGRQGGESIRQRLRNICRLYYPQLKTNDLGDMSPEQVRAEILPLLQQIRDRGY